MSSSSASGAAPLVTVGVPTYRRPELLRRALECVAAQDYRNIEVLVADNCTPGDTVQRIVDGYRARVPMLRFIRHACNIGSFANFFSLLEAARGAYFMWLADDDEISPNYVSALVDVLELHPDASCAAGHWLWMHSETIGRSMVTASFPERSPLLRALRFIWRTDDAFFYGLHRRSVLRQASFPGYWWPNQDVLQNWGYVFLLDVVLRGRILLPADPSVCFINHDYTSKYYATGSSVGARAILRFLLRRLNVHWLYLCKTSRTIGVWAALPVLAVSLAALCRELGSYFGSAAIDKMRRFWRAAW